MKDFLAANNQKIMYSGKSDKIEDFLVPTQKWEKLRG